MPALFYCSAAERFPLGCPLNVMRTVKAVFLSSFVALFPGQAQTRSPCRPATETRAELFAIFAKYARDSSYAEYASALQLPLVSVNALRVVDDSTTCAAAVVAYRAACARPEGVSGRVQVVRMGTVYIVYDPDFAYNPAVPAPLYITFDLEWKFITRIGSAGDDSGSLTGVAAGGGASMRAGTRFARVQRAVFSKPPQLNAIRYAALT